MSASSAVRVGTYALSSSDVGSAGGVVDAGSERGHAVSPRTAALGAMSNAERLLREVVQAAESHDGHSVHLDVSSLDARDFDAMAPELRRRFVDAVRLKCTQLSLPAGASTAFEWLPRINQERLADANDAPRAATLLRVRFGDAVFVPLPVHAEHSAGAERSGTARLADARALQRIASTYCAAAPEHSAVLRTPIPASSMGLRDLDLPLQAHIVSLGLSAHPITHRQRFEAVGRFRVALRDATHQTMLHVHDARAQPLGFHWPLHSRLTFEHALTSDLGPKSLRAVLERCVDECGGRVHLSGRVIDEVSNRKLALLVDVLKLHGGLKALHIDVPRLSRESIGITRSALKLFASANDRLRPPEFGLKLHSASWLILDAQSLTDVVVELPLTTLDISTLSIAAERPLLIQVMEAEGPLQDRLRELKAGSVAADQLTRAHIKLKALESLEMTLEDGTPYRSLDICSKLDALSTLKHLTLGKLGILSAATADLALLRNLESLGIERAYLEAGVRNLAALPKLRHLSLHSQYALDESEMPDWAGYDKLQSLELLQLRDSHRELGVLRHLPQLERFSFFAYKAEDLIEVARHLPGLPALTALEIPKSYLTLNALVPQLEHFGQLKSFTLAMEPALGANEANERHIDHLTSMTKLECLKLRRVGLGDDGLTRVVESMRALHTLHIDTDRFVGQAGVSALAQCAALRELRLADCPQINDACVQEIARCGGIEVLDLNGCNGIGDASVPALTSMSRLVSLNVENTVISGAGKARLARSFELIGG